MVKEINIAIAGLGTVGQGVVQIIQNHPQMLRERTGHAINIVAVNAGSRTKNRDVDISQYEWMDDAIAMAARNDIDVFIELIGGEDGVAKASVETALRSGKSVITANKALIAHHGHELAALAEANNASIRYEAAVAGGIPVIKSLGEGLAGNQITRISGILNGTCNYMLSRMENENIEYGDVFEAANALGYLEADPSLDVGGIDAAHKLAILTALGFNTQIDFDSVEIEGIENVSLVDIKHAGMMGYRIKLVCSAERRPNGVRQRVAPALVHQNSPLGQCMGVTNMVVIDGDAIGQTVLQGPGAGRLATASAVMGDLCDLARGISTPIFGVPLADLAASASGDVTAPTPYYLRMSLNDQVGILANVAQKLADHGISIDEMRQLDHEGPETPLVIITHRTPRENLDAAVNAIGKLDDVLSPPIAFRIEN